MSELIYIDAEGAISLGNEETRVKLANRPGCYLIAPTAPGFILGIRDPCVSGQISAPRVALAGDISAFFLADLVAFINQSRSTGLLKITDASHERSIVFNKGEIQGASSDDPSESLEEIALRTGLINDQQLEFIQASCPPTNRVGRMLVEAGFIKSPDLWRCLQQQVAEIVHSVLLCNEGVFVLMDQPVEELVVGNLAINTQGLLMDSLRRIDEMKEFRKRLPSSQAYVTCVKPASPGLDAFENQIYQQCTGERTVSEIAQTMRMSEFDVTKAMHHLMESGLIILSQKPRPSTPVPRAPTAEDIIKVFNQIFREILSEINKQNMGIEFIASANGALAQLALKRSVLWGLSFNSDGSLCEGIVSNCGLLEQSTAEATRILHEALSEAMFFMLFEAGELLDHAADEDLARRVKMHLSVLDGGEL